MTKTTKTKNQLETAATVTPTRHSPDNTTVDIFNTIPDTTPKQKPPLTDDSKIINSSKILFKPYYSIFNNEKPKDRMIRKAIEAKALCHIAYSKNGNYDSGLIYAHFPDWFDFFKFIDCEPFHLRVGEIIPKHMPAKCFLDYDLALNVPSDKLMQKLTKVRQNFKTIVKQVITEQINIAYSDQLGDRRLTVDDVYCKSDHRRYYDVRLQKNVDKTSFHFIVSPKKFNLHFSNLKEVSKIVNRINDTVEVTKHVTYIKGTFNLIDKKSFNGFDTKVYHNDQMLRLPGSRKSTQCDTVMIMEDSGNISDYVITHVSKNIPSIIIKSNDSEPSECITKDPKHAMERHARKDRQIKATDVLGDIIGVEVKYLLKTAIPAKRSTDCYNIHPFNYDTKTEMCPCCKVMHGSEVNQKSNRQNAGVFVSVDEFSNGYLRCYANDDAKNYINLGPLEEDIRRCLKLDNCFNFKGNDDLLTKQTQKFILPCRVEENPFNSKELIEENVVVNKVWNWMHSKKRKAMLIKSPTGTGKTQAVRAIIEHLDDKSESKKEEKKTALIVVYRQTLAYDFENTFGKYGFRNYLTDKGKKGASWSNPRQIISVDSFRKIFQTREDGEKYCRQYDYVILDESESIFKHLQSTDNIHDKRTLLNIITGVLNNSGKILALDALMTDRTYDYLSRLDSIKGSDKYKAKSAPTILHNTWREHDPKKRRQFNIHNNGRQWMKNIIASVKAGQNIVIASMSLKQARAVYNHLVANDYIKEADILLYFKGMGGEVKSTLKNIKEIWATKKVVIYTPSIESGVDFDVDNYFDKMYVFMSSQSTTVGGLIQMMGRIRHLKDNKIDCLYDKNYVTPTLNSSYYRVGEIKSHMRIFEDVFGDSGRETKIIDNGKEGSKLESAMDLDAFDELKAYSIADKLNSSKNNLLTVFKKLVDDEDLGEVFLDQKTDHSKIIYDQLGKPKKINLGSFQYHTPGSVLNINDLVNAPAISSAEFGILHNQQRCDDLSISQVQKNSLEKRSLEEYLGFSFRDYKPVQVQDKEGKIAIIDKRRELLETAGYIRQWLQIFACVIDPKNYTDSKIYHNGKLINRYDDDTIKNIKNQLDILFEVLKCFPSYTNVESLFDYDEITVKGNTIIVPKFQVTSEQMESVKKKFLKTKFCTHWASIRVLFGFEKSKQPNHKLLTIDQIITVVNQLFGYFCFTLVTLENNRRIVNGKYKRIYTWGLRLDPRTKTSIQSCLSVPELLAHKFDYESQFPGRKTLIYDSLNILPKIYKTEYWSELYLKTLPKVTKDYGFIDEEVEMEI